MLDNWSLNVTPNVTVTPVNPTSVTVGTTAETVASTFTVGFPLQQLSGSYTIQLGPNIEDEFGDGLDTNQNAGVYVLQGVDQQGPTTTVSYNPTAVPEPISETTQSSITVPDSFVIEGDETSAQIPVMEVQLNITYPNDPDLTVTLTHTSPSGDVEGEMTLFSGVGAGTTTSNFDNTVLDDLAATPIQVGAAPFFSTYTPQQSLANAFSPAGGQNVQGTWTLSITNSSTTGTTGTLNSWSLTFQRPLPSSGLGEPGADDVTASFQIFSLGQSDALSSQQWTAVGPAAIGSGTASGNGADPSGRVTGLAVNPSDPSGNTVYAAGACGGVWKTTDFLTTSNAGPTWIPLTSFGPTDAVNIGGIAVFARNNDPNQSIVVAATGEGDTGTPGVGFLISTDGGATWNLYDSTDNVDAAGNLLPIDSPQRDRKFVGDTAYAVVVNPEPTPSGGVIIYAALSGPTGGIWRSENTGQTWSQVLAGQATSVVLDADSSATLDPDTNTYVQGNDQIVYAAIEGQGVYMSPNQGQIWNQLTGDIGNPLIFNDLKPPYPNINPTNGPGPNGPEGRITLAVPASTGNAAQDDVYEGWVYALVANPGGALDGIFVTKDFGENWTEVNIPTDPNQGYYGTTPAIPVNNVGDSNYSVIGDAQYPQGNYNQAMAVDPTNPNIIYVGGTADGNQSALIRIDLTDIWDAHAEVPTASDGLDNGAVSLSSQAPATIANAQDYVATQTSYLDLIRNPEDPFVGNSTIDVYDVSSFTNNGDGVNWIPLSSGGTDYHRMLAITDPTTGLPRLIIGDDQGIWTYLDNDGTMETGVGLAASGVVSDSFASNARSGNIQITQLYYGAVQPSTLAAQMAGALFYGSAQDNGGPTSSANILSTGDIVWGGPGGDAGGVATNQQGTGTFYQYWWPCCYNYAGEDDYTDFFEVNGVGETTGLIQASNGGITPDPQWPFKGAGTFAVNPVNGNDIIISSATGNIFSTINQGTNWFDIGQPGVFNNPGTFSVALAYGAPDPAPRRASATWGISSTSARRSGRSTSRRTAAAAAPATTGSTSPPAWTARPSSRSSPTRPAAATTPTR